MKNDISMPTGATAVVVNDDPTQLNLFCGLVRRAGLEPRSFTAAEAALAEMSARAADGDPGALPALVITDLHMPGLDGWRFCRLLRSPEYAAFNQVPILVVSATFTGDEPDRITADLGAEAFLPSPVDGRRFVEQVQTILKGQQVRIPIRVLIVEDSKTLAGMLKNSFVAHGYQADTALTARAAADAFVKTAYDVVVLDYHLPDGSGDTLLDAFRAERPDCVCLMMTTDPGPELALDWMKRGAAAYLRKPFEPDYLIELCAKARRECALLRVLDLVKARTRELRESEQILNATQRLTKVGGWEWDVATQTMTWTEEVYRIHDFEPGELTPGSPEHIAKSLACYTPEDRPVIMAAFQRCVAQGEPYDLEFPFTTAKGCRLRIRTTAKAVLAEGRVAKVIGNIMDITERKRVEEELLVKDRAMASSSNAIAISGLDGKLTYVNNAFLQMWGYTLQDALNLNVADLASNKEEIARIINDIKQKGFCLGEFFAQRKDGSLFLQQFSASLVTSSAGDPIAMLSSFVDITERKRAEEALRESEERFKLSMEATNDGLWDWNIKTDKGYFSPGYYRMLGYDVGTFPAEGNAWKELIHPNDREHALRANRDCIEGRREYFEVEYRMKARNGEWRWILGRGKCIARDEQGRALRLVGTHVDITERKQAEEEKAKLEAQFRQAQKMESVGRLAGGVAHDFNNMLGVILGHTEIAMSQVDPAQPLHGNLAEIRKATERSADLTRQLLAFARKQTIAPKVLDLNETVAGMLKMLQRIIGEDIHINWQPKPDLWPVKVDPSQINQILANLCVNARDAIADVGKITITTTNGVLDKDYCANHPGFVAGEYVRLAMSDDGCGMNKETLVHVFEPFFTTKGVGKGTGLGLATVYGIVKQNNGFINVYSEPGSGTMFTIYLPRHVGKAEQAARTEGAAKPDMRGRETILLVEDEPAILEITKLILEHQGYTVLAASTPGEAILLAREQAGDIHLLMTDVVMPEMNGRDLAKSLLSLYPDLKRLFISGYPADLIAHHGVLDEGVHFIQKPISVNDLAAKVREVLDSEEGKVVSNVC